MRQAERRPPIAIVFAFFWAVLFLLYLPAAQAGWVSDTLGWLQAVRTQSFTDFVSRKGFSVPSFYQLTQAITWLLYQIFGINRWAWHLLQLSLHALNATLLFTLLRGLLLDSGLRRAQIMAFVAATLFCTSPYVSETIVWEAAYHFSQGVLLLLVQLHLLRRFLHHGKIGITVLALALYALSLFSLELFYLVPFLNAALCFYYSRGLNWQATSVRAAVFKIVIPQGLLLLFYFMGIRWLAGATTGRLGDDWMKLPLTYYLVKPPEYLFHLLGGRFLPQGWRKAVYGICSSYAGAGIFYVSVAALTCYVILRFRHMGRAAQVASFLFFWLLISTVLMSALWFPERLLIVGDRYLYALLPPFLALLTLGIDKLFKKPGMSQAMFLCLLLAQMLFVLGLNRTWRESNLLTERLEKGLPDAPDRITILLNNPASLRGALMIGAGQDGEAKLMHTLFYGPMVGKVHDAPAQNLLCSTDSTSIRPLDSQTIKVSLTHPGAFWQYGTDVARSFATDDFSIDVIDPDCCYILHLSKAIDKYQLLYQQNGIWHEFHMSVTSAQRR